VVEGSSWREFLTASMLFDRSKLIPVTTSPLELNTKDPVSDHIDLSSDNVRSSSVQHKQKNKNMSKIQLDEHRSHLRSIHGVWTPRPTV
jgi:hypothetical protein